MEQNVEAKVIGIPVENGKNVVHLLVNGSRVPLAPNILGFARLAKAGVRIIEITASKERL